MKLADAKNLRDEIRQWQVIFCTVPLGHGPAGYFARIYSVRGSKDGSYGQVDFRSRRAWLKWKAKADAENEQRTRDLERALTD